MTPIHFTIDVFATKIVVRTQQVPLDGAFVADSFVENLLKHMLYDAGVDDSQVDYCPGDEHFTVQGVKTWDNQPVLTTVILAVTAQLVRNLQRFGAAVTVRA